MGTNSPSASADFGYQPAHLIRQHPVGIREVRVESLGQLIEAATPATPDPQSGRLRDNAVYRGVGDASWPLLTSLDRLGLPDSAPHAKSHLEEFLLRGFIRYSRPYLPAPASDWELLVVAQHHGLPTRLLDWTYSPLVAAHMATLSGPANADRAIWKLDWKQVHQHFGLPPLVLMVGDLDRVLRERGWNSLWEFFGAKNAPPESWTQPNPPARTGPPDFVCMLEPPALDARIVAQSATFTLCSDKTRALDEQLTAAGLTNTLTRFIIPAAAVGRIRDQLDLCSLDERRLFPDLDGVAAAMRRYYC